VLGRSTSTKGLQATLPSVLATGNGASESSKRRTSFREDRAIALYRLLFSRSPVHILSAVASGKQDSTSWSQHEVLNRNKVRKFWTGVGPKRSPENHELLRRRLLTGHDENTTSQAALLLRWWTQSPIKHSHHQYERARCFTKTGRKDTQSEGGCTRIKILHGQAKNCKESL
jgi:hypothetical protein